MTEEETSVTYWDARDSLQKVIDSGWRGSKEEILEELNNDLE